MPELPEVEVVRRGLAAGITGRQITAVEVLHPRPVRRHLLGADDFAAQLAGRTFAEPRRRGKYLWLPLTDGNAVLAHLGMSGQFRLDDADAPLAPNTRVLFRFADGDPGLRFVDQRMFGGLSLSPGGAELPDEVAHIGRDPFDPDFDLAAAVARLRAKRTGIKRALLDQQLVSGIGNIYADEALVGRPDALRVADPGPDPGPGHRGADRRRRGDAQRSRPRRHVLRLPLRQRQRQQRLLRPLAGRVRAGGRALPALRHADPPGAVHEPVVLPLPPLPAGTADGADCDGRARVRRLGRVEEPWNG